MIRAFDLAHFEVVAPSVRNDGTPSGYPEAFANALVENGFNFTETATAGWWNGKHESGVTFTLYAPECWNGYTRTEIILGQIARSIMVEQEAIQVVKHPNRVTLTEA